MFELRGAGPLIFMIFIERVRASSYEPGNRAGARFSKVPVTSGPDNLSGPLSENFIGPDVAFLEAPVNFPGNFRAR